MDKLCQNAQEGDYFVSLQDRSYTILHINYRSMEDLVIDEITIPQKDSKDIDWKTWLSQGAEGYTSWLIYRMKLKDGSFESCFSKSEGCWIDTTYLEGFLTKLLTLTFAPTPVDQIRRIGPKPADSPDMRSIWQPKMFFKGKYVKGIKFKAWQSRWPEDGSEISDKEIEIYLPEDDKNYPSYFPYWLQVSNFWGRAVFRIVDSGRS